MPTNKPDRNVDETCQGTYRRDGASPGVAATASDKDAPQQQAVEPAAWGALISGQSQHPSLSLTGGRAFLWQDPLTGSLLLAPGSARSQELCRLEVQNPGPAGGQLFAVLYAMSPYALHLDGKPLAVGGPVPLHSGSELVILPSFTPPSSLHERRSCSLFFFRPVDLAAYNERAGAASGAARAASPPAGPSGAAAATGVVPPGAAAAPASLGGRAAATKACGDLGFMQRAAVVESLLRRASLDAGGRGAALPPMDPFSAAPCGQPVRRPSGPPPGMPSQRQYQQQERSQQQQQQQQQIHRQGQGAEVDFRSMLSMCLTNAGPPSGPWSLQQQQPATGEVNGEQFMPCQQDGGTESVWDDVRKIYYERPIAATTGATGLGPANPLPPWTQQHHYPYNDPRRGQPASGVGAFPGGASDGVTGSAQGDLARLGQSIVTAATAGAAAVPEPQGELESWGGRAPQPRPPAGPRHLPQGQWQQLSPAEASEAVSLALAGVSRFMNEPVRPMGAPYWLVDEQDGAAAAAGVAAAGAAAGMPPMDPFSAASGGQPVRRPSEPPPGMPSQRQYQQQERSQQQQQQQQQQQILRQGQGVEGWSPLDDFRLKLLRYLTNPGPPSGPLSVQQQQHPATGEVNGEQFMPCQQDGRTEAVWDDVRKRYYWRPIAARTGPTEMFISYQRLRDGALAKASPPLQPQLAAAPAAPPGVAIAASQVPQASPLPSAMAAAATAEELPSAARSGATIVASIMAAAADFAAATGGSGSGADGDGAPGGDLMANLAMNLFAGVVCGALEEAGASTAPADDGAAAAAAAATPAADDGESGAAGDGAGLSGGGGVGGAEEASQYGAAAPMAVEEALGGAAAAIAAAADGAQAGLDTAMEAHPAVAPQGPAAWGSKRATYG